MVLEMEITNISIIDMSNEDWKSKYSTLNKLHTQLLQDLEEKSQQVHDCKRELTRLNCLEAEYLSEIEALQLGEKNECKQLKLKIHNLEEEKNELKLAHSVQTDHFELNIFKRDEEICSLQEKIKSLSSASSTNDDKHEVDELYLKIADLKCTIEDLTNETLILKEKNEIFENQLLYHQEQNKSLKDELETLNENYKYKKEELDEAKVLIETLQEDLLLTKNEAEIAKCIPFEDGSQGNSLFAEVDDKRLIVQEKMAIMKSQYLEMKNERGKLLSQIDILNCTNAMLCQRWETENKDKESDIDKMEESYKARIKFLECELESCKEEVSTRQKISANNLDAGEVEFMENMLEAKNKEIEKLQQDANNFSFSRMILSRQLRDANTEIRNWRAGTTKLECELGMLQAEVEQLKLKKNSESESAQAESNFCVTCVRNKRYSTQVPTNRPKLKDIVQTLEKISSTFDDGHFSTVDNSRQIKRSLLKEANCVDIKESGNGTCEGSKENISIIDETQQSNTLSKRVQFAEGTLDNSNNNKGKLKKGAKTIYCKPMVLKKRC